MGSFQAWGVRRVPEREPSKAPSTWAAPGDWGVGGPQGKGPRPHSSRAIFRFTVWERGSSHYTEVQKGPDLGQEGRRSAEHWPVPSAAWNTAV